MIRRSAPTRRAATSAERPVPSHLARILVAVLAVVAVVPFAALFADRHFVLVSAGAAALVTAVSLWLSPRRPLAVSVGAATLALSGAAAVGLAVWGIPDDAGLAPALATLFTGWEALLVAPEPVATEPLTMAVPVLGAAVAALAGVEAAARSRRAVLGALPSTALLVLALAYAGHRLSAVVVVPIFITGVLALAALDRTAAPEDTRNRSVADRRPRRRPGRFPVAAAGVLVAVAVTATAVTMAVRTTDDGRFDLRAAHPPDARPVTGPAPLSVVATATDAPADAVAFRAAVRLPPGDARERLQFRVATLEHYDGELWRPADTFVPVGSSVSGAPVPEDGITQSYSIAPGYPLALLPELGEVAQLRAPDLAQFRYGRETGMVLGPERGAAPLTYDVVGSEGADPDPLDEDRRRRLTALPEPIPGGLREYARSAAGLDDGQRLASLRDLVRDGPSGFSPQAPPGHAYPRLIQFLYLDPAATPWQRTGTSEQAAAAFVTLARVLGHPARVVVGYDVPAPPPGADPAVRELDVPTGALKAWAEVHLGEAGWVAFDPTSPVVRAPAPTPRPVATTTTTRIEARREPERAREPATPQGSEEQPCPNPTDCAAGSPSPPGRWPLVVAVVAVLVLAAVAVLRRIRRRRARRHPDPGRRLDAAWRATLTRLRRHGVRLPPAATPAELGRLCAPTVGEEAAAQVARWGPILDAAVYGPSEPTLDLADAAWTAHDDLAAVLRRQSWPTPWRGPGRRRARSARVVTDRSAPEPAAATGPADPDETARAPSHAAG